MVSIENGLGVTLRLGNLHAKKHQTNLSEQTQVLRRRRGDMRGCTLGVTRFLNQD
jgi:hypothetical protein